jgi:antitoxin PrlF
MDITLTSKGQTTIPKAVREHLGVKPGDKVKCVLLPDGQVFLLPRKSVAEVSGMLRRPGQRAVSVEDMNEGIAQAAFEADHRSKSKRDKKTVRKPK